ncbi:metalloregulator ArsR/SmtB family transcription factor [Candidatus Gracilibacteria bacterium]|nr:metalloregulator ArsR/SmtB family transcription factor [Candidatus Gracilibacteria bacterium]
MKSLSKLEIQAEQVADTLKLLAHPKRLLILCKLSLGPKTVGDLEKECFISQSQLSQFLAKMKDEKIVTSEKKGLYVTYQISNSQVQSILDSLASIYCKS